MSRTLSASVARELFSYDPDTGLVSRLVRRGKEAAGTVVGWPGSDGYLYVSFEGHHYALHRLAYLLVKGVWPSDEIDHEDLDKINNRWGNIRPATKAQNMGNLAKYSTNTSGFKGVGWHKHSKKWRAYISIDDTHRSLGYFDTPEDAHSAFVVASLLARGEFARTA